MKTKKTDRPRTINADPRKGRLTTREMEVLHEFGCGHKAKAIAAKFNCSPRTVEHHCYSLRKKLGAITTAHAVALASAARLIQFQAPSEQDHSHDFDGFTPKKTFDDLVEGIVLWGQQRDRESDKDPLGETTAGIKAIDLLYRIAVCCYQRRMEK